MAPSPPADRREKLTLTQLASYDDILTDALVDRVRFPSMFSNCCEENPNFDLEILRLTSGPKFGRIGLNISRREGSLKMKSRRSYFTMSSSPKTFQRQRRRSLIFPASRSLSTALDLKERKSGSGGTFVNISPSIFQIVRSRSPRQIAIRS
jgi:hypothetical protein